MTTSEQGVLFDIQLPPPVPVLSAGRRLTLRQHALVAAGFHPLAKTRTAPELGTCGDCVFRVLVPHHTRTYPKCMRFPTRITHSVTSDCRAWWPACPRFERKTTVPEGST